jgi:hypothetical protein
LIIYQPIRKCVNPCVKNASDTAWAGVTAQALSQCISAFLSRCKGGVAFITNQDVEAGAFAVFESCANADVVAVCAFFKDVVSGNFLRLVFGLSCHRLLLGLRYPFGRCLPSAKSRGSVIQENWGQPSGGAGFLVDAGRACEWQEADDPREGEMQIFQGKTLTTSETGRNDYSSREIQKQPYTKHIMFRLSILYLNFEWLHYFRKSHRTRIQVLNCGVNISESWQSINFDLSFEIEFLSYALQPIV